MGRAVQAQPKQLAPDEKEDHIHELDAAVAHLYGLDKRDLTHIFEIFHKGWDYEERLRPALRHFQVTGRRNEVVSRSAGTWVVMVHPWRGRTS